MDSAPGLKDTDMTPAPPEAPADEQQFPDPDEDDLDDLDDMLDDFSAPKQAPGSVPRPAQPSAAPPPTAQAPRPAVAEPGNYEGMDGEEITRQLQAGVDGMINELQKSPELQKSFEEMLQRMLVADSEGPDQLKQVFDQIMKEEQEALAKAGATGPAFPPPATATRAPAPAPAPAPAAAAAPAPAPAPAPASAPASAPAPNSAEAPTGAGRADVAFQETIRRTMERMQESGEQATAAAAEEGGDLMSEMLRMLSEGTLTGQGADEDFSKMLLGIMEQISSKEVLYEPMKELHDKYPAWFAANRGSTAPEDLARYDQQLVLVRDVVAKFELSSYSDANAADREYIWERMQKMQTLGSPPSDLVGDLASAQECFAAADEHCNTQ